MLNRSKVQEIISNYVTNKAVTVMFWTPENNFVILDKKTARNIQAHDDCFFEAVEIWDGSSFPTIIDGSHESETHEYNNEVVEA